MTKSDAMVLLGTNRQGLAAILDVDPTAISKLPHLLPQKKRREVLGAALDHGIHIEKVNKFTNQAQCKTEGTAHNG